MQQFCDVTAARSTADGRGQGFDGQIHARADCGGWPRPRFGLVAPRAPDLHLRSPSESPFETRTVPAGTASTTFSFTHYFDMSSLWSTLTQRATIQESGLYDEAETQRLGTGWRVGTDGAPVVAKSHVSGTSIRIPLPSVSSTGFPSSSSSTATGRPSMVSIAKPSLSTICSPCTDPGESATRALHGRR